MRLTCHFWLTNAEWMLKYPTSQPHFSVQTGEEPSTYFGEQGYILVSTQSIDVQDIPQNVLRAKTIETLQAHLKDVRLKAAMAEKEVTSRINDLLMIGYTAGEREIADNTIDEVVNRVVDLEVVREVEPIDHAADDRLDDHTSDSDDIPF